MKKIKLDLNDLRVESFETTLREAAAEGTVFGQTASYDTLTTCTAYAYCGETAGGNKCGGTSAACNPGPTNCAHLCFD